MTEMKITDAVRDLNLLNEQQLKEILYELAPERASIHCHFTDVEIVLLIDHPSFEKFSPEFKEFIRVSVSEVFERKIKGKDSMS
ncbi:MAG: hypothetical protein PHY93_20850 [Bacteriovorax sp.]|nr:hypothetical protein [Bacteriovorax sp.]